MPRRGPAPPLALQLLPDIGTGLAPVFRADARVLVLGSFPGEASLRHGQYYAHPRNQFWQIFGELADARLALPYAQRLQRLCEHRIALWDVLEGCRRTGSLDSSIRDPRPNPFGPLLQQLPTLQRVLFNGAAAATLFERRVRPHLSFPHTRIDFVSLPSTSPAHASKTFAEKLDRWRRALE